MSRRLKIGGRLDRYVAELFLSSYAAAFFILVGLFLILDMASNLDEYLKTWRDGSSAPTGIIVRYYITTIPFVFLQVAPFVTLVAGMFTCAKLLKHSEVTAALAAGIGMHRLLAPICFGALVSALGMAGLREALSFDIGRQRDSAKFVLDHQSFDEVYEDLWLRDPNGGVVHIGEFRPRGGSPPAPEIRGLEVTLSSGHEWSTITASHARFERGPSGPAWKLENGTQHDVAGVETTRTIDRLDSDVFSPELVFAAQRARANPMELSYRAARELAWRDPDSVVYVMMLQYDLTSPLANLVLIMVGLPLLLRRDHRKGVEGIVGGFVLCMFYFSTDFVLKNLGLQGTLDPYLAAWLPVLIFGSLGLTQFSSLDS